MWHAHDGMGWWMLFSGLLWLLFLGTIVWLVLSLLTGDSRQRRDQAGPGDDALEVARRRYAAGEITREEFQQIRDDLTASHR